MKTPDPKKYHCGNLSVANFFILGLVIVWIIFSIAYILGDVWTEFKVNSYNYALTKGREEGLQKGSDQAYLKIMSMATNEKTKCSPIPLVNNDKIVVQLVNLECVQRTNSAPGTPPAATIPGEEMSENPTMPTE